MINIHLNGDIVRCPDIQSILLHNQGVKQAHNICKYNIQESDCPAWAPYITAYHKFNGIKPRCILCGSDCPGRKSKIDLGNKEEKFKIDQRIYLSLIHISEPTRPY